MQKLSKLSKITKHTCLERFLPIQDSLRYLFREYILKQVEAERYKSNFQSTLEQFRQSYPTEVQVECQRIQKVDSFWHFFVEISNLGGEEIDALTLTLKFKNEVLLNNKTYAIKLHPYESQLFSGIYLDLSGNNPLQLRLSTHPGGINKLPAAISCSVTAVTTTLSNFISTYQNEIKQHDDEVMRLALAIETFAEEQVASHAQRLTVPINKILANNINEKATFKATLTNSDTLRIGNIKAGNYALLAYTIPENPQQWYETLTVNDNQFVTLTPFNQKNVFHIVTEDMIEKIINFSTIDTLFSPTK